MNYLAHAFLSFGNEPLIVGNYIADHIKLANAGHLPPDIKQGVLLHRRIDHFTDTHPLFIKSKRNFYEGFERYSGVLVDIFYDHILAKNFSNYSDVGLQQFTEDIYATLWRNKMHLPESSVGFLNYAEKYNTFFEYSKPEGIELVLKHLSHRIDHGIWLNESMPLFLEHQRSIEEDFFQFFEELMKEAKAFKSS